MRYTICSECRSLFAYGKLTCPECHMHHSRETVQRVKLCSHDGTPMPVNCSFCPACGWDMRRLSIPIWLFAPLVLYSLIGACIVWITWSWRLFKYGRSVVGTVIEREVQQGKYGVFIHCTVSFKTQTNPALNFQKRTHLDLHKRQRVDVFYDPLYPEQTARIGSNLTLREMRLYIFLGSLAILLLLGMLGGLVLVAFFFD